MRYIHQHIATVLNHYKGEMPLANYLKFYFKKYPILGSRDRKMISEMAYCYYRCAKGFTPKNLSITEKLDASLLLAESNQAHILKLLPENLQPFYGRDFDKNKIELEDKKINFDFNLLFDNDIKFSEGITKLDWLKSMLRRPKLFIRVVPQFYTSVIALLKNTAIDFEEMGGNSISCPNGTAIERKIPEKMYRIQDASSQQTANYFKIKDFETCWDCCSGAGGKSLLVKDIAPQSKLCVSDTRKSILDNLAERFDLYGFEIPERLLLSVADKDQGKLILGDRKFDHIIADVPCSGSGTWARTPEQLYFFNPKKLVDFSTIQKQITNNAIQYLKVGGTFVYITCSVFTEENEKIVSFMLDHHKGIKLISQQLINGIKNCADSMFVAVFELESN
jgi:16S rRNA (cytosine967-C5)-methyltransferase